MQTINMFHSPYPKPPLANSQHQEQKSYLQKFSGIVITQEKMTIKRPRGISRLLGKLGNDLYQRGGFGLAGEYFLWQGGSKRIRHINQDKTFQELTRAIEQSLLSKDPERIRDKIVDLLRYMTDPNNKHMLDEKDTFPLEEAVLRLPLDAFTPRNGSGKIRRHGRVKLDITQPDAPMRRVDITSQSEDASSR